MAGVITKPAQANGQVTCRGTKNGVTLQQVTAGIAAAVNTYLDGTPGTDMAFVVDIKVTPLQVAKPA